MLDFELLVKKQPIWHLGYVKASKGEIQIPLAVPKLINQRQLWLQTSFATRIHAMMNFKKFSYGRGKFRMLLLRVQMLYNALELALSWFALGILTFC